MRSTVARRGRSCHDCFSRSVSSRRLRNTPTPIPLRFFRIITLQTFSRHRIERQWFTSIFFYCSNLRGITYCPQKFPRILTNRGWLLFPNPSPPTCQRSRASQIRLLPSYGPRDTKPLVASVRIRARLSVNPVTGVRDVRVLAQPEMEKRRSPLVSIPPFGMGFSWLEGLSIRSVSPGLGSLAAVPTSDSPVTREESCF